ncbi:hypothetical protein [Streptomyces rishiriensis]|uniref:Integral membrane protein n=1 Tax=Streptomyces rishiriensis TaxID=68264 RepID=A0ABU0NII2_STRRH|nr:hypothetical protein [Streptomyces rishiriensis]MDQ0578880.1 hypothetical protein [Streptomyces rishiriensis]
MTRMPVTARYARVLLVGLGLSGVAASARLTAAAAAFESGALGMLVVGMLLLAAAACAALAVTSLVLSARFANGGGAVRRGAVAVGWVITLGGPVAALAHHFAWGAGAALGVLLVALSNKAATREWFGRARPLPA